MTSHVGPNHCSPGDFGSVESVSTQVLPSTSCGIRKWMGACGHLQMQRGREITRVVSAQVLLSASRVGKCTGVHRPLQLGLRGCMDTNCFTEGRWHLSAMLKAIQEAAAHGHFSEWPHAQWQCVCMQCVCVWGAASITTATLPDQYLGHLHPFRSTLCCWCWQWNYIEKIYTDLSQAMRREIHDPTGSESKTDTKETTEEGEGSVQVFTAIDCINHYSQVRPWWC